MQVQEVDGDSLSYLCKHSKGRQDSNKSGDLTTNSKQILRSKSH